MSEKKFTPKEAAIAVLKKAEELYKASALAKSEEAQAQANPDEKQDAQLGEQVEEAVHQHEASDEHPGQHADGSEMKGHIKLAKFMGRMEHKKGQKAKEMEKADGQTLGAAIGYPGAAQTAPPAAPPMIAKGSK